jgi:hypothetical protein
VWARTQVPDPEADGASLGNVRPCHFCHSTSTSILRDSQHYFLCCDSCEVYGPEATGLVNAVDKWNSG